MQTLIFLTLAFLPPLISGPLPAVLVFKMVSGLNWRRQLLLAGVLAIILNLIASAAIISNLDGLLPSGIFACGLTPISAIATLNVSLHLLRRTSQAPDVDPLQRRWLRLSLLVIPALQMLTLIILVLIAPVLCSTGIRACTDL